MSKKKTKVKLADFGLATSGGLETNLCCGSPGYMAPEILRNQYYNAYKTDTWSLGVILHEMLDGFTPFYGETPDDELKSIESSLKKGYR